VDYLNSEAFDERPVGVADVGGTKTRVALYENDSLKELEEFPTPKEEPLWKPLWSYFKDKEVQNIVIATMGPLKMSEGKVVSNPHSQIKDQEVGRPLMERLKIPVLVINDCVAGAYAEFKARNVENLVYLAFGTGVGAGAVVDGRLLLGREGNAHEVGHFVMSLGLGLRCGCGKTDHAEAVLGGSNIVNYFKREGFEARNAAELFNLIRSNPKAFELFKRALNSFVSSVIAFYDPEVVVLGGGVFSKNKKVFFSALEELEDYLLWEAPKVEEALYGELSPLYGAGALGVERPQWLIKKLRYVFK